MVLRIAVGLLLLALTFHHAAGLAAQSRFTLEQVVQALINPNFGPSWVETEIERRGVDFEGEPTVLDLLKNLGATEETLSVIPPSTAIRASERAGPLTVICEPADCFIVVNDRYLGTTEQGRATVDEVAAGEATVLVFSDTYGSATREVQLHQGQRHEERFTFAETAAMNQQRGMAAVLGALNATGGIPGVIGLQDLQWTGVLEFTAPDGEAHRVDLRVSRSGTEAFELGLRADRGECSVQIPAARPAQCRGNLRDAWEDSATRIGELFIDYQVQRIIPLLLNRTVLLTANGDGARVETQGGEDSYVLRIDADGFPLELVHRQADTLPRKVEYGEYRNVGNGWYATQISISHALPPAGAFSEPMVFNITVIARRPSL